MCMNYWALNNVIIKHRFPILRVDDLLDVLKSPNVFTKIDLRSDYHQPKVKEDINTGQLFRHRGHCQCKTMPFGLTNAPGTFQVLINRIFEPYLCMFVLVFFDDMLIFSKSMEEHTRHLDLVVEIISTMLTNREFAKDGIESSGTLP